MRDIKDYFVMPDGFKLDYVKAVYKRIFPFLFLASLMMITVGIVIIGQGAYHLVRSKDKGISPLKRMGIGFLLMLIGILYSRWYVIVFYPEGMLTEIL